jgi:hypothetical protein
VGVGLRLPMTDFCKDFTWLYFPDPAVPFYRVTMFSRLIGLIFLNYRNNFINRFFTIF